MVVGVQNGKTAVPQIIFYLWDHLYLFLQLDVFKHKKYPLTPFKAMKQNVKFRHMYKILNIVLFSNGSKFWYFQ